MPDRRTFLKTGAAALAAAGVGPRVAPAQDAAPGTAPGRLVLSLNRNWRFHPARVDGATTREFDDSALQTVAIPHTNVTLPWHGFDEKTYQFVSTYRRTFTLPAEARGRLVFADFDGAMTASIVWINGHQLGEYKGGYTPFSFDLTPHVDWDRPNVLVVELDSSERADIPPFGGSIDYLTFGGLYRDVRLRIVSPTHIEHLFVQAEDVLTDRPRVMVHCRVARLNLERAGVTLEAELRDGDRIVARSSIVIGQTAPAGATPEPSAVAIPLVDIGRIERWSLSSPRLYSVVARLRRGDAIVDEDRRRVGFREARFTDHGFELNGEVVKLRGLNRHQTFPFVGQAMPARVQRRDAEILKKELKINIVRTSHYPPSPHFLDACDDLGLLVLEEIPGWNHIGDAAWKDLAVDNVARMIRRDQHHPSIVLWGVRINESRDDHDFYTRTNATAHELDPTRQTGGIRDNYGSELLEDVFTMNDFGFPLRPSNHPRYLNTEFIGHTYPTKPYDAGERLTEHALRHARVHNQIGSNAQYSGGIGWCAFDYDTHGNFGSGDRICYHGVSDIFRLPKPAAFFYASQCDPSDEIVLEPAFDWSARGDWSNIEQGNGIVFSNCDHLKLFVGDRLIGEADPDREGFPNLPYPPFKVSLNRAPYADLRIEGHIGGSKVIEKRYSVKGIDAQFLVAADDSLLFADGADATRVVMRVADEFGRLRRYATAAIALSLDGPGDIVGDNPFSLVGGCGAVWIRARQSDGMMRLTARHPALGSRTIEIRAVAAPASFRLA